jgi:hypothetical protein
MTFDKIIKQMQDDIAILKKGSDIRNLTFPVDGKLVLPNMAADPEAVNGKIYYNTATNKVKVCENGVWKTVTTT